MAIGYFQRSLGDNQKKQKVEPETPEKPPVVENPPIVYLVAIKNANIRSTPNPTGKIVAALKVGEKGEKLGTSGEWFNIKLPSGKSGWVFKDLVGEEK